MTDLDSPNKNNDCYFYYYLTCAKGDTCTFRHEPSAFGCETTCNYWKKGKCLNEHCNFRHMELRKNSKVIPCYWESQPVGCLKANCSFHHQNPRQSVSSSENPRIPGLMAVNSLVINLAEESDSESDAESGPSFSPIKDNSRINVKTLEEIKLEKIQREVAAYYQCHSYESVVRKTGNKRGQRMAHRMIVNNLVTMPEKQITEHPLNLSTRNRKRSTRDELGDESL